MSNGKPYLLGRICEKPKNKREKTNRYKNDELIRMADKIGLKINRHESNNNICSVIRHVLEENNINTYDEFDIFALNIQIGKYPSFNDFMMFQPGLYSINKLFNGIDDINKFSKRVYPLGENSANGFIRKLNYIDNGKSLDVVLKSNQNASSDNPYYEYLAGQCINEFSKYFPFFARTYSLGKYTNTGNWNRFKQIDKAKTMPHDISAYLEYLNIVNLDQDVQNSCIYSKTENVFIQFINIKISLNDFFLKYTNERNGRVEFQEIYEQHLTTHILILYLVYSTLSKLANYFTHYDLHMNNVVLYEIPNNQYIDLSITMIDGNKITLKSRYLPIIIDYGRSYFNCDALKSGIVDSTTVMKKVCEYDTRNRVTRVCRKKCGDDVGYSFMGNINGDGSIANTNEDDYYINLAKRNISHDLRLLSHLKTEIMFDQVTWGIPYIGRFVDLLDNINYASYHEFGMPETEHLVPPHMNSINNIHDVAKALESIIKIPEFINDLNIVLLSSSNPDSYGNLSIDFSTSLSATPFHFIKY